VELNSGRITEYCTYTNTRKCITKQPWELIQEKKEFVSWFFIIFSNIFIVKIYISMSNLGKNLQRKYLYFEMILFAELRSDLHSMNVEWKIFVSPINQKNLFMQASPTPELRKWGSNSKMGITKLQQYNRQKILIEKIWGISINVPWYNLK